MNFSGPGTRLRDEDLSRIGEMLGVGEDEIHAVLDVECAGKGHDSQGRPKMLFEPHVFYRNLTGAKRVRAVERKLAYAKWVPGAYPKDSYPRLLEAMAIDEEAALKAASWGMPQILGENHKLAGYPSAKAMVEAFVEGGEPVQLEALAAFVKAKRLDKALQQHDWAAFARGYNGGSYAKHGYHTKLAAAYRRWAGIPDTPYTVGEQGPETITPKPRIVVSEPPASTGEAPPAEMTNDEVAALQELLRSKGYFEVGKVDGFWGPRVVAAISAFQASVGLPVRVSMVPTVDAATLQALAVAPKREVSPERAQTTAEDLRQQGSKTVTRADAINWAQLLQIGMAVLECVVIAWQQYERTPLPFGSELVLNMATGGGAAWLLPIAQFAFALYTRVKANGVIMARLNAERSGQHNGEPDPAPSPPTEHPPEPNQGLSNVRSGPMWFSQSRTTPVGGR